MTMPRFSKLDNVYLGFWSIFDKYISHVIVTKTIYFIRYCNKRNSTENWLEAKVNVVQIQKTCYLGTQLTEIYQHRVVPQNLLKKGAPYCCFPSLRKLFFSAEKLCLLETLIFQFSVPRNQEDLWHSRVLAVWHNLIIVLTWFIQSKHFAEWASSL